jgi:DNA-binding transcriptional LysR family regulator
MDTRISLYKLEVLCEVVARGSVTRAAAALGVAQPVVSAHLRSLERRLGVALVQRDGRGVRLTPAGEIAHRWAADVVGRTREASTLLDALGAADAASLGVVTSINGASNGIAEAAVRFQATHPGARLELRALPTEQAVGAVLARDTDFAVVSYLAGMDVDRALRVQRLADDELVLVASPSLAAAWRAEGDHGALGVDAFEALGFICTPGGSARRRVIDAGLAARGVWSRRVVMEVGSEGPFHAAVRDGIGYALLSRRTVGDELAAGALAELPLPGGPIPVGIDLVWRRDQRATSLRRAFRREIALA